MTKIDLFDLNIYQYSRRETFSLRGKKEEEVHCDCLPYKVFKTQTPMKFIAQQYFIKFLSLIA